MSHLARHSSDGRPVDSDDTFVLVARGAVVDDHVLDLVDLAPSTIRVEWAGGGQVTYLSTGQFLDLWEEVQATTVPADLGLLAATLVAGERVRLDVRRPRIVGSGLRWNVTDVHGWLPHESGACVLVVNPPGPPVPDCLSAD